MKVLSSGTNQALGLGAYAIEFLAKGNPSKEIIQRVKLWHTDLTVTSISYLRQNINPSLECFKNEALMYKNILGGFLYDNSEKISAEKAVMFNIKTILQAYDDGLGYNSMPLYYPIAMMAAQQRETSGINALKGMLLVEEIRARLKEVLQIHPCLDEFICGGIACVTTYGALIGVTENQIDQAIGLFIKRLPNPDMNLTPNPSEIAELSIVCIIKVILGQLGPENIFQKSIFKNHTFDITLPMDGNDFHILSQNYRLGIYYYPFSTAIEAFFSLIRKERNIIRDLHSIENITFQVSPHLFPLLTKKKSSKSAFRTNYWSLPYTISLLINKLYENKDNSNTFNHLENIYKSTALNYNDFFDSQGFEVKQFVEKIQVVCGEGDKYKGDWACSVKVSLKNRNLESSIHEKHSGGANFQGMAIPNIMYTKARKLVAGFTAGPALLLSKLDRMDTEDEVDLGLVYDLPRLYRK
ncbi:hypothetical protein SteCoe_11494 [Stentor coeruleus]|uniref:Uncharacterized protein n=1 Tax=Stentor coeruleus TaxID=5963 RepID=A0A1R2CCZ2_9CILI|nr:hypothetical protein SteCoe_11494 [Stentor coeruleus]